MPDVAAEFDREWEVVLKRARQAKDLAPVHDLLHKWRHFAYSELREPGTYFRWLATAAHTLATGNAPAGSLSAEDIKARMVAARWATDPAIRTDSTSLK